MDIPQSDVFVLHFAFQVEVEVFNLGYHTITVVGVEQSWILQFYFLDINKIIKSIGGIIVFLLVSYSHRETTYDTIDDYIVITHAYTFSTCETIEENDPVNTSKVFEVFANDYDNTFGAEDHFQTGKAVLFRENVKYSLAYPGDEIVDVDYYNNIYDCWNFPTDEEKYIGFRITKNGNSRYGWLKIKLHPTWGGKVVDTELIETAIQK